MIPIRIFVVAVLALAVIVYFPLSLEAADATTKATPETKKTPSKTQPVDINSAAIDDLKMLPGIDDAYARKIVDNRPYQKKDQLVSRKVIPEGAYNKIKDRIIAMPDSKS